MRCGSVFRAALALCLGLCVGGATPLLFDVASLFELEGDAVDDPSGGAEDWDVLYAAGPGPAGGALSFTGVIPDYCPSPPCEVIYTGGGSRDDFDLPAWQFQIGNPPDNDDISNAYAATYRDAMTGHLVACFGLDRYASNDGTQVGFWFLQGPVDFDEQSLALSGSHVVGDLLVLSSVPAGGAMQPMFSAYRWVGSGGDTGAGGSLQTLATGGNLTVQVNTGTGSGGAGGGQDKAPWPYEHKDTGPGDFPPRCFIEGRADVSALFGGATPCAYTTFVAATRTGPMVGTSLRDVVIAPLPGAFTDLGDALPGAGGPPALRGVGSLHAGTCMGLQLTQAAPNRPATLFTAFADNPTPFKGGLLHPVRPVSQIALFTNGAGEISLSSNWPGGLGGLTLVLQYAISDPTAVLGVSLSNAILGNVP
jgi:hypothetical protein